MNKSEKIDIIITRTITEVEELNTEDLRVLTTSQRDCDSVNLDVYYNDIEIGYGHLNNKSNMAHITLNFEDNQELIDYLVEGIENRTIDIE